jgi:hypothetical protein
MSNKYSLYVVIVIAAIVGIAGFLIGRGARDLQVMPIAPAPATPLTAEPAVAPSNKPVCDGRQQIIQDDLYIKGSVSYSDGKGAKETRDDECVGTGLSVNKTYCYESPFASGNFVPGKIVYNCQFGCGDGACKANVHSDFAVPYPITWNNDGVIYSLTGAAFTAAIQANAASAASGTFASGGILTTDATANFRGMNKITFYLKIENTTHAYKQPQITLRYLSNENGDLAAPSAERLSLPANDAAPDRLGPLLTAKDQEIDFAIPANIAQYEFTAASSSGIFFTVGIGADGNIELTPEATNG